jgi:hypothetical protein
MGWRILIFYLEPHILASMNYFDSDMSKSTNTVVYFYWKTILYIYACEQCRTQLMLPFTTGKSVTCTNYSISDISLLPTFEDIVFVPLR